MAPRPAAEPGHRHNRLSDYDAAGNRKSQTDARNVTWNTSYDALNRLIGISYPTASLNVAYRYDNLYRLTDVEDSSSSTLQAFTYNLTGDRQSKTISPQPAEIYSYTPNTHYLSAVDANLRSFDNNGNTTEITGGATVDFSFDDRNRMSQVSRNSIPASNYDYNAKGERVYKNASYPANDRRWFSYTENGSLLGEYTAAETQEYIWADSTPVAMLTTSGQALPVADRIFANGFDPATAITTVLRYIHSDQLDSPRALTSTSGTLVWNWPWQTNPFGESPPSGSVTLNLRFPGQYADAESELNYNYFREYESDTGRYVESDPARQLHQTDTYTYVSSSPFRYFDQLGLAKMCCRLLDSIAGSWLHKRHCYIAADDGAHYGLYPKNGRGIPRTNDPRDTGGECHDYPARPCGSNQNQCLRKAHNEYPVGPYGLLAPNSNTYAGTLARSCCKNGVPSGVHDAPGANASPPSSN